MSEKLDKISNELTKAKAKYASLEKKIKDLEERYLEQENTEIHDIVREACLTPESLAKLIARSKYTLPETAGNRLADYIDTKETEETDDEK